jgi:homeobox protein LBX
VESNWRRNKSGTPGLSRLESYGRESGWGLDSLVASIHCHFFPGRDGMTIFGQRQTPKKRRKSRTAFTNHQIYELEKRFLYQKYLSPADRDQIAQQLGLTNAQVITWFQNRRAKLKRDLEEMKADVESAKKLGPSGQMDIVALAELEQNSEASGGGGGGGCGRAKSRPGSPALPPGAPQAPGGGPLQLSPASPLTDQRASSQDCSEDEEDEEIDVDD